MSTVDVLDVKGKKAGSVELPAEIFDVQVNVPLMHQVVVGQLAAARQGTHSTKTRGEVRGGGRKPYRQKGTGRARQGSTRAPQFVGGGVVFGPHPRDYSQRTPKKMKAAALRAALSDRARSGRVHVLAGLVDGDTPSTKLALTAVGSLNLSGKHVLVVVPRTDELAWKSLRNVASVHLIDPGQLNTYDVLVSDDIVFTQGAFDTFVAGAPRGKSVKASASSAEVSELVEVEDEAEAPAKAPAKKAAAKKAEPRKPAAKKVAADEPKKPAAKKAAVKTAKADTAEAAEPKKPAAKKTAAKKAEPAEGESKGDDE
jgi:large subunit ribosomal protein L4